MYVFQLVFSTDDGGRMFTTQGYCLRNVMDVFSWDISQLVPIFGNRPDLNCGKSLIFQGISRCLLFENSWRQAGITYTEYLNHEEREDELFMANILNVGIDYDVPLSERHTMLNMYVADLRAMGNMPPSSPTFGGLPQYPACIR